MYCVSATYTPRGNVIIHTLSVLVIKMSSNYLAEGGINVDNEGFATDGSPSGILGYAEQNDPTHPGTLDLFFPGRKFQPTPLHTDMIDTILQNVPFSGGTDLRLSIQF